MAPRDEVAMPPLRSEWVVAMAPLDVYCAACSAVPREECSTIYGNACPPHVARRKLAMAPDECNACGAAYGEPCIKVSGAISMYPHYARLSIHADR